jgi:hypothetical protein
VIAHGIGFISILTATVASLFIDQSKDDMAEDWKRIEERLARVEHKQDELLARLNERAF